MQAMTPENRKLLETIAETRFPDEDETSNLAAIALAEIDSLTARLEKIKTLHYVEDWPSRNPVCGCCGEVSPCSTKRTADGKP